MSSLSKTVKKKKSKLYLLICPIQKIYFVYLFLVFFMWLTMQFSSFERQRLCIFRHQNYTSRESFKTKVEDSWNHIKDNCVKSDHPSEVMMYKCRHENCLLMINWCFWAKNRCFPTVFRQENVLFKYHFYLWWV